MKKMMLLVAMVFAAIGHSAAQDKAADNLGVFNHVGVGVGIGTTGVSIDVAAPITPYVAVRGGVDIFPTIKIKTDLDLDGEIPASYTGARSFEVEGKTAMTTGHLLFDLFPFKDSGFHFTVGAYFGGSKIIKLNNTQDGALMDVVEANRLLPADKQIGLDLGDFMLTPDDRGNVDAHIKVAGFRPYLGLGFGRPVPAKHRFTCNFDMGVQMWGTPEVYLRDNKLDKTTTNKDAGEVLKYISKAKVYPVLSLRIVGRIL